MGRRKIHLKYKKERAILSDVLPYELPIIFTNREFYRFLVDNHIEIRDNKISWLHGNATLDNIIYLMFCLAKDKNCICTETKHIGGKKRKINIYHLNPMVSVTPFSYKINHKETEFRELTVPHPRSQIALVDFYDTCKETMIYYCSKSNFSIRKPVKIAKYKFHKDKTHYKKLSTENSRIEEHGKEYENLKSFFVYKSYSNIYKFYENYKYHRCEKKYNCLLKLDISKCFDSIYTHCLPWSMIGKKIVKKNLSYSKEMFAGKFDRLMQNMNSGETNGIIVGPEFSRIFAEILLQSVDIKLEEYLKNNYGLINRTHYEIFRYVDDYFIFYNKKDDKHKIETALSYQLKDYKLYLNSAKSIDYEKPIITSISIAKQKISALLNKELAYAIDEKSEKKEEIYIKSQKLITKFKAIIKECNISYEEILNYTLATVERQSNKILEVYFGIDDNCKNEKEIINAIISILEFIFFICSVSPRLNTTIRLCRIIKMFCSFLKDSRVKIKSESKHLVYKYIYDNSFFIINKNKINEHAQVETSYLLIALTELGKDYWLEENVLANYFNISEKNGKYQSNTELSYLSYTIILFYMRNKVRYKELRSYIEMDIKKYFINNGPLLGKSAELIMLLFDIISCPYISKKAKKELLYQYDIRDDKLQDSIINFKNKSGKSQLWFTIWENLNFEKELDAKQSQEVY